MMKFHINPSTGEPGSCSAKEGKCPYGADAPHFTTKEAARKHFEKTQEDPLASIVSKYGVRKVNRAKRWEENSRRLEGNVEKVSVDDLKNAAAYAVVKQQIIPAVRFTKESEVDFNEDRIYGEDREYDYRLPVTTHYEVLATPEGDFVAVSYKSIVLAYSKDNNFRYYPEMEVNYEFIASPEAAAEVFNSRSNLSQHYHLNIEPHLSTVDYRGLVNEIYDRYDIRSAETASRSLIRKVEPATVVARVARLENSTKKFPQDLLTNSTYLGSTYPTVRMAVAGRKELPKSAHEQLLNDKSPDVRRSLAGRSDLNKETVEKLLADKSVSAFDYSNGSVRAAMLESPGLPVSMMRRLVREGSLSDMRSLHRNKNLSPAAREALNAKAKQLGIRL